MIIPTSWS